MRSLRLVRNVFASAAEDMVFEYAATLAYYFLFSLFPLMLALGALLSAANMSGLVHNAIAGLALSLPREAANLVSRQLEHLLRQRHSGLLSVGTVLTLVPASQGFSALIVALDRAYEVVETRSYLHRQFLGLALTLSAGILVVVALAMLVFGRQILFLLAGPAGFRGVLALLWPYIRWAVVIGFFILAIALLYRTAPNLKHRGGGMLAGALTAFVIWLLASVGLAWYTDYLGHYSATYGSLAAVIALMIWFYILGLSLLLGAEVHNELLKEQGIVSRPKGEWQWYRRLARRARARL